MQRKTIAGRLAISATSSDSSNGTPNTLRGTAGMALLSAGRPKFQNERDFAFSRRSLMETSGLGASLPPNLNPAGMGAPFMGPESFDRALSASALLSGEGTRSGACTEGWNDLRWS